MINEVITKQEIVQAAGGRNKDVARIMEVTEGYVSQWHDENIPKIMRFQLAAGTAEQRKLWRTIQKMRRENE